MGLNTHEVIVSGRWLGGQMRVRSNGVVGRVSLYEIPGGEVVEVKSGSSDN